MKTQAAVLVKLGEPLEIVDLELPALKPGQALVEVAFSGVCHTQLGEVRGLRGPDAFLPHCLGHEASGYVRELGPGVQKVREGQAVILSWIKGSGANVPGTTYSWHGRTVNAGGVTTFARFTVVSENRLTPLADGFPLREAALLGCPVPTGVGAVLNTAAARAGQSLAVFGVGGIGCCAVAGARVAGGKTVIAVDINPDKLKIATAMGATHAFLASEPDLAERIKQVTNGELDIAIEATGQPAVMRQCLELVRPQGGIAVVVGNARFGELLEINPRLLNDGKQLRGTWGGDNDPDRHFPHYCQLVQEGRISLAPLLSGSYALSEVNRALDELEQGKVGRPILNMAR